MIDAAVAQASLEAVLKDEILHTYQEVADNPDADFHFFHGRKAAELFGYASGLARPCTGGRGCVIRWRRQSARTQRPVTRRDCSRPRERCRA